MPRRRGHGEGGVYQRKSDQRWVGELFVGWDNGKRKRKYYYGATRREVADKLSTAQADLKRGLEPADERTTLGTWLAWYVDDLEARGAARPSTVKHYRAILRNYLQPALGQVRLARLQPHQVHTYQSGLIKHGLASKTITVHRAILSGALNAAASLGMIPRNVVGLVKPPKENAEPTGKVMPPEDARRLLAEVENDPLEVFYLLLLTAGLRRGEAIGLPWQDVVLPSAPGQAAWLRIHQQLLWPEGVPTISPVKSKHGVRTIPIPPMTARALERRRELQRAEFAAAGRAWSSSVTVVTTPKAEPIHHNTITKQFHAHRQAAGLGHYRPHDLRHTYGSLLMSQGVPLKTISQLLGHSSIEITADIYLHSLDVQVEDTANAVTRALEEPIAADAASVCPACGRPFVEGAEARLLRLRPGLASGGPSATPTSSAG